MGGIGDRHSGTITFNRDNLAVWTPLLDGCEGEIVISRHKLFAVNALQRATLNQRNNYVIILYFVQELSDTCVEYRGKTLGIA